MWMMTEGLEGGETGRNISAEQREAETDFSWAARAGDVILINTNPSTLLSLSFSSSLSLSLLCSHVYPWRCRVERVQVSQEAHTDAPCESTADERKVERLLWRAKRSATRNLVTTLCHNGVGVYHATNVCTKVNETTTPSWIYTTYHHMRFQNVVMKEMKKM